MQAIKSRCRGGTCAGARTKAEQELVGHEQRQPQHLFIWRHSSLSMLSMLSMSEDERHGTTPPKKKALEAGRAPKGPHALDVHLTQTIDKTVGRASNKDPNLLHRFEPLHLSCSVHRCKPNFRTASCHLFVGAKTKSRIFNRRCVLTTLSAP